MKALQASVALVLAIGLGACTSGEDDGGSSDQSSTSTAQSASAADFVDSECPTDVASVVVGEVTCGYLTVPEDRTEAGREVRLFVARIQPPEVMHEDPMLVAGSDLANLPNYGGVAPLAQRVGREVIIMDTRGVGHSEPSLACPEVDEIRAAALSSATDDEATRSEFLDAVAACHDRVTAAGVDPGDYNLTEMADDAEDLRTALEIDQWNVATYGTASRIALEMLRQSPDHLRSVLLDSPEMPGTDPRAMAVDGTRAGLAAVLDACASTPRCATAYPDTGTLLDRALTELADQPVTVEMTATGQPPTQVRIDDALLLRLARGMLSDGGSSGSFMTPAAVPAVLDGAVDGRLHQLAATLATTVAGSPPYCLGYLPKCLPQHRASIGTAYSVLCHDIDPLHDAAAVRDAVDRSDRGFAPAYGDSPYVDVCDAWPVASDDDSQAQVVDSPVESDVPVLALTGAFSPYTPEGSVGDGLGSMSRATLVVDPAGGHNVVGSDCLVSIRAAWLDDLDLTSQEQECLADQSTDWVTDLDSLGTTAPGDPTESPSAAPSDPATGSVDAGLEGVWQASLTRDEIRQALAEGGRGGLVQQFFETEGIEPDGIRIRTTFEDGRFTQAYLGPDGVWQVGWEAATTFRGDTVMIVDDVSGGTDTLRWRVAGDVARLTPVDSSSPLYKGIPQMAYLWAYFAADAHRRAE